MCRLRHMKIKGVRSPHALCPLCPILSNLNRLTQTRRVLACVGVRCIVCEEMNLERLQNYVHEIIKFGRTTN